MDGAAHDHAFQLVSGFRFTQMVRAVVELKIPDLVAAGPQSAEDLAATTGVKADPLRRIMRCLVTVGVFTGTDEGTFGATPLSECFRDQPGTMRGQALMLATEPYVAFGDIMHTLQTGEPAFEHIYGMPRWDQLTKEPEKAAQFNAAMQARTQQIMGGVAAAYDFSGISSVIDVGGGRGTLLAGLLKAHPHLRGTVFDLEAGVAEADAYLKEQGVRDRCEIVSGSFFDSIPTGHDLYVLKNIVHDWKDAKALAILASCRKAMGPQSLLMLVEHVMPARAEDSADSRRIFMDDVQMLVMLAGRERTEDEYAALMRQAGLRLTRVIPTDSIFQLIEGVSA
jgi:orsellinic acid C2-O-methyltransferase